MNLTAPDWSIAGQRPAEAAAALRDGLADLAVDVQVAEDPSGTPERLSPGALDALGGRPS